MRVGLQVQRMDCGSLEGMRMCNHLHGFHHTLEASGTVRHHNPPFITPCLITPAQDITHPTKSLLWTTAPAHSRPPEDSNHAGCLQAAVCSPGSAQRSAEVPPMLRLFQANMNVQSNICLPSQVCSEQLGPVRPMALGDLLLSA